MGLTGDNLNLAIQTAKAERPALVDDFLFEGDVLILAGASRVF